MYWKYWGKNVRHPADSGVWAGRGRTVMGRADSAVRRGSNPYAPGPAGPGARRDYLMPSAVHLAAMSLTQIAEAW